MEIKDIQSTSASIKENISKVIIGKEMTIDFIITATITLITYRNSKAYKEEDTFQ